MKRKFYATSRERKADQIKGFLAFPLVNVPLGIILWMILQMIDWMRYSQRIDSQELTWVSDLPWLVIRELVSTLPWLVNGIVLVLAFLFRPEFGVGYVAFIAIAITASTALSVLFVAACFVTFLSAIVIGDLAK
ncbi:MAG TPA: hypothetical protein VJ022_13520, partial [Anaerolineales bacterium]|nr:hypothetical protein [Anaerolineales bacterium]